MPRRHPRHDWERPPRRRRGVFSLAALAVLGGLGWLAPAVLVHTSLRDRPLQAAFAGIDGSVSSAAATWRWLAPIEYRDVVLRDAAGRAAVMVPLVQIDRGLARLALSPHDLGTIRIVNPEALVEVRHGGSSLEEVLAPWLARIDASTRAGTAAGSGDVSCDLELVGGTIELVDLDRRDAWRLTDVCVAGRIGADGSTSGWTAAGRLRHAEPQPAAAAPASPTFARIDRGTIPAAATAALTRDGGWSVSAPAAAVDGSRIVTLATHRLPLGGSAVIATRFGGTHLADGLADVRLDVRTGPAGPVEVRGNVSCERFAICASDTLTELFLLDRCDVPLDLTIDGGSVIVRRFAANSPAFRAEASGRIGLPASPAAGWLPALLDHDFSLAVEVDLAAAAQRLPGGIAVRPDVRVTGGTLSFGASVRADGGDRLLETRATARDVAATCTVAGGAGGVEQRDLEYREPGSAWLRARRSRAGGGTLRIEEARLASPAVEVSASGSPTGLVVQWTANLGQVATELAQLLDLGATSVAGTSRGRIDITPLDAATTALKLAASASDLEVQVPGLPAWRDRQLVVEFEGSGSPATGLVAVDRARGAVAAGGDRLEFSLAGGILVDPRQAVGAAGRGAVPVIRPAGSGAEVVVEGAIAGDLAGWRARLAPFVPVLAVHGLDVGGTLTGSCAAEAVGGDWRITRAEAQVDGLVARLEGREIGERRVVATATGVVHPDAGQVEVTAGEILSATLSLRTGGMTWQPAAGSAVDGLRGRVQWQADIGRLEGWLLPRPAATAWPATGRAWGTLEVVDTQAGTNLLVEATGSQVTLASGARQVWGEPQMKVAIEVTRPLTRAAAAADRVVIDRLSCESSTLSVAGRGVIDQWSTRRIVELEGSAAYDWEQLSRLAVPWTGGRVRLAGAGSRPFAVRGPLRSVAAADAPAAAASPAGTGTLPLPDAWLAATRGRDASTTELTARVTRPAAPPPARDWVADWLRGMSLDTSTAWAAADLDGFAIAGGELPIRLLDGQLAFGPCDIPAAGGRLRGAPWLRLVPGPGELMVPPGRVVDRVALSGEVCDRWVRWLSPMLGHATHTSGVVTVDLAGARIPLADPFAGEAAGQVIFENLEVAPSGSLQPLVGLIAKLQSVVDPRFAFGDKAVLMRVRPEPVRVRLSAGQFAHEGLVMDAGQFTVRSAGTVAADGRLAMAVEVALRGDVAGTTPVVAQLVRTPITIPLAGTIEKPQFDARAIDLVVGRILENTAQAVIVDGFSRGLDAIIGGGQSPPPGSAAAPPPLALPPQ